MSSASITNCGAASSPCMRRTSNMRGPRLSSRRACRRRRSSPSRRSISMSSSSPSMRISMMRRASSPRGIARPRGCSLRGAVRERISRTRSTSRPARCGWAFGPSPHIGHAQSQHAPSASSFVSMRRSCISTRWCGSPSSPETNQCMASSFVSIAVLRHTCGAGLPSTMTRSTGLPSTFFVLTNIGERAAGSWPGVALFVRCASLTSSSITTKGPSSLSLRAGCWPSTGPSMRWASKGGALAARF